MIDLNQIYQGDILQVLKTWPDSFVQCVVTSPPYWGLRDYGVEGQIGLEKTPEEYVSKIVNVFREIRRILTTDGILWINLGDSYASHGKNRSPEQAVAKSTLCNLRGQRSILKQQSKLGGKLKPKDLVGIPWRVALALQSDGWYLRSDVIWSKPNPMPESVQDRPTKAHEYIFLLTKSNRYFYDAASIREPMKLSSLQRLSQDIDDQFGSDRANGGTKTNGRMKAVTRKDLPETQKKLGLFRDKQRGHSRRHAGFNERWDSMTREEQMALGSNRRSVWNIPTEGIPEAHFATFPEDIPMLCIKSGSRESDIVLDPFLGSGTVAVVAKRLKRRWVGIELNPAYIEIANRRISYEPEALLVE